jgi:glycerol kinase
VVRSGKILVVDVGTSSVRVGLVDAQATASTVVQVPSLPSTPAPGVVEFDASAMGAAVLSSARRALLDVGEVDAIGIANQRATTVVWDARTGVPIGPALGWQDLRTVIDCLVLQAEGLRLAPNASATKIKWLLDTFDPERSAGEHLRFGTIDTWVAWILSDGEAHITDITNAGVTGLLDVTTQQWDQRSLDILGIPSTMLPRIVDTSGELAEARALPGSPMITAMAGDQQASLFGQGCTTEGLAKITFGTGGMLDMVTGPKAPPSAQRSEAGTFPIAAWRRQATTTWGLEAIMLSAGSCVEWLRDDLGILADAAQSAEVAAACASSGGVVFVPALLGLATPTWDFGARGLLLGLTRGSGRAQITRAVLEGIAQRGRDLVDAAEADAGRSVASLRIDGGMSTNEIFLQALADAVGRPIEVSPVLEATTLGAGVLAGMAVGLWADEQDVAATWAPRAVYEPSGGEAERDHARERFLEARGRAERTIPDLSGISF